MATDSLRNVKAVLPIARSMTNTMAGVPVSFTAPDGPGRSCTFTATAGGVFGSSDVHAIDAVATGALVAYPLDGDDPVLW